MGSYFAQLSRVFAGNFDQGGILHDIEQQATLATPVMRSSPICSADFDAAAYTVCLSVAVVFIVLILRCWLLFGVFADVLF